MFNLNETPADDGGNREFSLIPNGAISRAVIVVKAAILNCLSLVKASGSSNHKAPPQSGWN